MPFFSIVIPAFNRAREIGRALDSCIHQEFSDFEIVVVDDHSTDGTVEVIGRHADVRIRLVCHDSNRGVCPARNTGVLNASGEWIVFLDSDDELLPGALRMLYECACDLPIEVGRIASRCRRDGDQLSPDPWPDHELMDYEAYIRWTEGVRKSDFNNCIRRTTFDRVKLPGGRAYEALYHLDFARHFTTFTRLEPSVIVHSDAVNRAANLRLVDQLTRAVRDAPDAVTGFRDLLVRHGDALRRWAPKQFRMFSRALITSQVLAKEYPTAVSGMARYIRRDPGSPEIWVLLFLCAFGPYGVAMGRALRERLRSAR